MGIENNFNLKALLGSQQRPALSTDDVKEKKSVEDVPIGKSNVESEENTVGLDTFVRASGANALAAYNKVAVKRHENAPQVNTSPAATEARLTQALAMNVPEIAEEAGVPVMATVNGLSPEILAGIEQTSLAPYMNKTLAMYLNSADADRIDKFAHYQEIEQYA